ncbi:MAG: hypothetical protein BGO52_03500 [Sphingobacteriales bacterium 44-61]|nr:MAG: hypothetical protein BGO52_03500 [Sphingobacteriales bacterium 44-61]
MGENTDINAYPIKFCILHYSLLFHPPGIRSNTTASLFRMQFAVMKKAKNIYLLQRLGKVIAAKVPAKICK